MFVISLRSRSHSNARGFLQELLVLVNFLPLMHLMSQACFSVELEVWDPDCYDRFQLSILPPAFLKEAVEKEVMIKAFGTSKCN